MYRIRPQQLVATRLGGKRKGQQTRAIPKHRGDLPVADAEDKHRRLRVMRKQECDNLQRRFVVL